MTEIATGVWVIPSAFGSVVNCYLLGDVLIDAGLLWESSRLIQTLRGRTIRAHALTHAHPDHMGGSRRICRISGAPLWCGEADVDAAETGRMSLTTRNKVWVPPQMVFMPSPSQKVSRTLREGDAIGNGFIALETPGHTMGHLAFWREKDRILICGDVMMGMSFLTMRSGVYKPFGLFSYDMALNYLSAKRLAALRPNIVGFGHGPVLRNPARLDRLREAISETALA